MGKEPPHACGVGQSGGLYQNGFVNTALGKGLFKLVQAAGTEHAAAGNLFQHRGQLFQEASVHPRFSKLVDNQPDFLPGEKRKESAQESGFSCAEKSGDEIQAAHAWYLARASRMAASSSDLEGMMERYFSSPSIYKEGRLGTPIFTNRATFSL